MGVREDDANNAAAATIAIAVSTVQRRRQRRDPLSAGASIEPHER
jgi:hypothetical protein